MNRGYYFGSGSGKYKNRKCTFNGLRFDSVKECNYYIILHDKERRGEIRDLRMQVKFELQPAFKFNNKTVRAIYYIADFVYYDQNGVQHIVDTKGVKTDVYKLKKKLFQFRYNKEIEEV